MLIKYIGIGGSLAFAAAVQPGPLQAYLLTRSTSMGWKKTLPASFSPLLSDGPIALLALLVLGRLSPIMQSVLRSAGGFLLLYFAWSTLKHNQHGNDGSSTRSDKTPKTIYEAAVVNLLNPNPYLSWALILGPTVMAAWKEAPGTGVAFVAAFYVTMVSMLALFILFFGSARFLSPKLQSLLMLISVIILAVFGVYQLVISAQFFNGLL
ncbi:MAG: LysE family transporter [Deltaproteobacteria bacterium]|nr:LysE family transporter [Deltaproteobacteria bacterium]